MCRLQRLPILLFIFINCSLLSLIFICYFIIILLLYWWICVFFGGVTIQESLVKQSFMFIGTWPIHSSMFALVHSFHLVIYNSTTAISNNTKIFYLYVSHYMHTYTLHYIKCSLFMRKPTRLNFKLLQDQHCQLDQIFSMEKSVITLLSSKLNTAGMKVPSVVKLWWHCAHTVLHLEPKALVLVLQLRFNLFCSPASLRWIHHWRHRVLLAGRKQWRLSHWGGKHWTAPVLHHRLPNPLQESCVCHR